LASINPPLTHDEQRLQSGLLAGLAAYILWGFLPVLLKFLDHIGSVLIVAERTVWSLIVVGIIMLIGGRIGEVRTALKDWPTVRAMMVSSIMLAGNWLLYVWAVETGQLLEATFGYFINPMVNVAIGMVFLGERQNRMQTIAIGIAIIALGIQAIGIGRIPFIALGLAFSFALYGFVRKTAKVQSTAGLFVETLMLAPIGLAYVIFTIVTEGPGVHADLATVGLLALTGPATAAPLLLFAFAVQRLRLTTIGMLQYIAPSIGFVLAITVFAEHLNLTRAISFGLIWLSLAVFTAGSMKRKPVPVP
jgi:chloramphenicol-sensitive protein RarD